MLKLIIISIDLIVPSSFISSHQHILPECALWCSDWNTHLLLAMRNMQYKPCWHCDIHIYSLISLGLTWHVTVTRALDHLQYLIRHESHVINNSSSRLLVHPCVRGSMSGGFSCNDCLHMATCSCALVEDFAALGQHQYCMILLWTTSSVGLQSLNHMNGITWMGLPVGVHREEMWLCHQPLRECVWPQNLRSLPFPSTMIYCSVTSCKTMNCQKMSTLALMSMTVLPLIGDIIMICPVISPWNTKWHNKKNTSVSSATTRTWAAPTEATCWMIIVSASSCVMAISTLRETAPWLISTGNGSLPVTMSFPFSTF